MVSVEERPYQFGCEAGDPLIIKSADDEQTTSCDANCNSFCTQRLWDDGSRCVPTGRKVRMNVYYRVTRQLLLGEQWLHKQVDTIGIQTIQITAALKNWIYLSPEKSLFCHTTHFFSPLITKQQYTRSAESECKFQFILNCCVGAKELVYILYYIV